jgi:parallel beta-helix repeat protein
MTGDEIIRRFRSYPFGSAVFQRDCIAWARRMLETSYQIRHANNPSAGSVVSLADAERLLIRNWCSGRGVDIQQAISARAAERGCKEFLRQLGYEVIDASIGQVLETYDIAVPDLEFEPRAWKIYDLKAFKDNHCILSIDIKSARVGEHKVYSRFFVKQYKQTTLEDVEYFAVLMPNPPYEGSNLRAIVLGTTTLSIIRSLQKYADSFMGVITIDFKVYGRGYGEFIPPYIFDFNNPPDFYREQRLVCEHVRNLSDAEVQELLSAHGEEIFPVLLASRRALPQDFMERLEDWEQEFVQGIICLPVSDRISLPYLFIYLLQFFVRTVNQQIPPNFPAQWLRWIYGGTDAANRGNTRPLGIYDPKNIIWDFVMALDTLYRNMQRGSLRYESYEFRGPGLMRATAEDRSVHTLLAYCGKCLQWPLVWGREETCRACGYLVCSNPECHSCKEDCVGRRRLLQSNLQDHSQSHGVKTEWETHQKLTRSSVVFQLNTKADIENLSLMSEDGVLRLRYLLKFHRKTIEYALKIYDTGDQPSPESMTDDDLGVRVEIHSTYRIIRDQKYPIKTSISIESRIELNAPRVVELPEIEVQWLCSINKRMHSEVVCGACALAPASVLLGQVPERFDLKQAIAEAEPRDIILIPEGEYILDEPLRIDKPLLLLGSGMERTVLVNNTEDAGVYVDLPASQEVTNVVQFYGITIRSNREDSACGMRVLNGTAYADYCRFEKSGEVGVEVKNHAKFVAKECEFTKHSKDGVTVRDQSSAEIEDSLSASNGRHGVLATDSSKLFARNNTCEGNKQAGIALFGSAQGELESNTCRNNGYHGIAAHEQSHLVARNNTCEGNKQVGIMLIGSAQGELESNTCRQNEQYGIYAGEQSRLVARNNTCEENQWSGIALFGSAQGELESNTCRQNERYGIYAGEQSRLVARNNTCEGNQWSGIALFGSAQGELESNTCRQNEQYGIYAGEQSRLVARNNTCEENQWSGIALFGSAQGELQGNTCRKNEKHGIYAQDQSRLVARNNTCEGNQWGGIALFGSAQGDVSGNVCRNNGYHGIAANEQSHLVARNNTCEGNKDTGIALFGSAQGELQGNTCRRNTGRGIHVAQGAHVSERDNICEENAGDKMR